LNYEVEAESQERNNMIGRIAFGGRIKKKG
jgi:hypothetical protein